MEKKLLEDLLKLLYKYSKVKRATSTKDRYELAFELNQEIDFKKNILRESLIEHIGQLPIIATFLHPHIQNKDNVDLPRALAILAVHDIVETELGDIPSSTKEVSDFIKENELALKMVDPSQLEYYKEYENPNNPTALFAYAVDKFAPFLNDMLLPPQATRDRLNAWGYSPEKSKELQIKREKYFNWDPVIYNIYKIIREDYTLRRKGKTNLNLDFIDS